MEGLRKPTEVIVIVVTPSASSNACRSSSEPSVRGFPASAIAIRSV